MKIEDLKRAAGKIQLDEKEKRRMIEELSAEYESGGMKGTEAVTGHKAGDKEKNWQKQSGQKPKNRRVNRLKAAAIFAICVAAAGALSIPVRALVNSYVKEHMEEVTKEELQELVEQIDNQDVEADGFSRSYTDKERARLEQLYQQYYDGVFPEGKIRQAGSAEEAAEYEFCFLTTTSVFYLPADRELTDEELLQIIDFDQKRNYALRQRYEEEHAGEIAAEEAARRAEVAHMVESGGVTEQAAVDTATTYLKWIFGLDGSGMEFNSYYDTEPSMFEGKNYYCVNWGDRGAGKYYYFYIDAADARLLGADSSGGIDEAKALRPSAADAPDKMEEIAEQAESFLENVMGISENYSQVECSYTVSDDEGLGRSVGVIFIKEDGSAYMVSCLWDGSVAGYHVDTKEGYEKRVEDYAAYVKKKADEGIAVELVRTPIRQSGRVQ